LIDRGEILAVATDLGLAPEIVEKDYVLGWLLKGIYSHPAMLLDFGLQWLFESADMIHSAFRVPAPQVAELADRFVRERRERMAAPGKGAEGSDA
jgi:hypothetical protein